MTAQRVPLQERPTETTEDGGGDGQGAATGPVVSRAASVPFAHESEREFARILDFYGIDWLYEPQTFAVRFDDRGRAIESFTPDFYLPELDLFVELTTLRQSLVTKKNRKLRLVKELYPDINIKLLYNRDVKSLMTKYGAAKRGRPEFGALDEEAEGK